MGFVRYQVSLHELEKAIEQANVRGRIHRLPFGGLALCFCVAVRSLEKAIELLNKRKVQGRILLCGYSFNYISGCSLRVCSIPLQDIVGVCNLLSKLLNALHLIRYISKDYIPSLVDKNERKQL